MIKTDVTIRNEKGLHARPATFFIQKANAFKSSVWVENGTRKANAKSLLGVLSLAVSKGDVITLSAEGIDEAEAVAGLAQLIAELED
jgi:phosphocarrier protein